MFAYRSNQSDSRHRCSQNPAPRTSAAEVADRRLQRRSRLPAGHLRSVARRRRSSPVSAISARAAEADLNQYWDAQTPPREPTQMKPAQQSEPLVLQASLCLTQTDPCPRRDDMAESICPWGPLRSLGKGNTETFRGEGSDWSNGEAHDAINIAVASNARTVVGFRGNMSCFDCMSVAAAHNASLGSTRFQIQRASERRVRAALRNVRHEWLPKTAGLRPPTQQI